TSRFFVLVIANCWQPHSFCPLLPPFANMSQVVLPSALSSARIGRNAALNDKYTVRFVANSTDVGAVQSDYPAPPSSLVYYFEITVVEPGSKGTIGLGFAHSSHNVARHVGWDAGTFGFHGDDGKTFFEGRNEYYGFKYGKGDVVGAALDFQRKEIFFTKNGTKGKAISISIGQALYPTVSLHSSGQVVSVNFGQKPFSFNIEPFKIKVGDKVAIKSTSVDSAKELQVGHGGWASSMEKMLGKAGVVENVDKDGDVRVKMDDGSGSMLWHPALVLPNVAALSTFTAGARVTIKNVGLTEAQAAQSGHGGWVSSMEKMLGKTGVVESVDKDGDVRVKMDDGSGSMLWNPSLVTLGGGGSTASFSVGSKATVKCVRVDMAKEAQNGHGGWNLNMGKYLGKTGTVSYKYQDGDIKIRFDSGDEFCWSHELVLPGTAEQVPTAYDVGNQLVSFSFQHAPADGLTASNHS
ncbi:hypothetical protein Vretifemale_12470, partial [Volvox reticuliferus]